MCLKKRWQNSVLVYTVTLEQENMDLLEPTISRVKTFVKNETAPLPTVKHVRILQKDM